MDQGQIRVNLHKALFGQDKLVDLPEKESEFLSDVWDRYFNRSQTDLMTAKQWEWLQDILSKHQNKPKRKKPRKFKNKRANNQVKEKPTPLSKDEITILQTMINHPEFYKVSKKDFLMLEKLKTAIESKKNSRTRQIETFRKYRVEYKDGVVVNERVEPLV